VQATRESRAYPSAVCEEQATLLCCIARREESGLCLRVLPQITVQNGGTIINDRGEKNEKGT